MIDDPDGKHAEEWYPMDQFATASGVGAYPMSKKKRIALLEKQVEDLQLRLAALEARPVPPVVYPAFDPWSPPLGPTCGPTRWGSTGDPPVDLTPRHAMESTDGVRVPGVNVTKNETAPDGSTIFEAEISAALLRSVNVTC